MAPENYRAHYLFVEINKWTMNVMPHSLFCSGVPWHSPRFLLLSWTFRVAQTHCVPQTGWGEQQAVGTASGHSVRAQHPGSLPLLQPGWQRSRAAWLAPSLACFLFFIILLPFGLNDCIWLTYFLTLGISLCFSTGALLAFVAERFLCSYAGLFNIPGHAH